MNEIEKMYKNANIAPKRCSECDNNMDCGFGKGCYPPFTTEKQLGLVKFLLERRLECNTCKIGKDVKYAFYIRYERSSGDFKEFTEALAGIINDLWQDLYKEEKQQVKGILE